MSTNTQSLIDLIGRAGSLTSEFAAFKSASTLGKIVMVLSALVMVGGFIGSTFPNSRLAVIIGAAGAGVGILVTAITSVHYAAGRQNLKSNAIQILGAMTTAEQAASALITSTVLPPVPVPVVPAGATGPMVSAKRTWLHPHSRKPSPRWRPTQRHKGGWCRSSTASPAPASLPTSMRLRLVPRPRPRWQRLATAALLLVLVLPLSGCLGLGQARPVIVDPNCPHEIAADATLQVWASAGVDASGKPVFVKESAKIPAGWYVFPATRQPALAP